MSIGETHGNLAEIFGVAASKCFKAGVTLIVPWRMDASQDHADKGLDECGCAFCPDDGQKTT